MRTLTTLEAKLYDIVRMAAHVRVRIRDAFYFWRDLTDIVGKDWLLGVDWDESIDQPVAQCTVSLVRDNRRDTLTFVSATRPNLLNGTFSMLVRAGLEFVVEVALMPEMVQPSSGNWREVFRGDIQKVSYGPNPMSFTGLDLGRRLQALFIEEEREYGSDAGVAIETVMQQILNDNHAEEWISNNSYSAGSSTVAPSRVRPTTGNATGFWYRCDADGTSDSFEPSWPTTIGGSVSDGGTSWTCAGYLPILYTPTSPGFLISPKYQQRKESVMDALKNLALNNLGWDVRYRWREATSKFELTFSAPDRSTTTAVFTFGPDQYFDVQTLDVDSLDMRNAVEGVYSDSADLDLRGTPKRKTIRLEDPVSQIKYTFGLPSWSQIAEPATSQIDTSGEMTDLLEAMLSDLSEPVAEQSVRMPYWYAGELWDLYAFSPNRVHYDSEQKFAVSGMRHRFFGTEMPETVLQTRGKPAVTVEGWIRREARPGGAMLSPFIGPAAPTDVEVLPVVGGFDVTFAPPIVGKWEEFEVHASVSSGFTPDASSLQSVGKATTQTISSLIPGVDYYVKVVPRDARGNRGTSSAEETIAAGYTTPRAMQPQVAYAFLPPNPDFEANNTSGAPPDRWFVQAGTWATDITLESATIFSGQSAVEFVNTTVAARLECEFFVVKQGDRVDVEFAMRVDGSDAVNHVGQLAIRWYETPDEADFISEDVKEVGLNGVYDPIQHIKAAPTLAKYARIRAGKKNAQAYTVYLDSVRVILLPGIRDWLSPALAGSWTTVASHFQPGYRWDAYNRITLRGAAKSGSGTIFTILSGAPLPSVDVYLSTIGDGAIAEIKITTGGVVSLNTGAATTYVTLDGLSFFAD